MRATPFLHGGDLRQGDSLEAEQRAFVDSLAERIPRAS
jgi:hypothetical protein